MKEKLRLLLRKPAVIALLIAELLVIGFALAAALRPAAVYTFTADQWENIAQESEIGYDEDDRIGVTEMTDGEDILQTPAMTLPKGHYKVTLDYRYVPSVWEGGVERRSCVYFASYDAGTVTGEKPCVNVKKQQDTLTLNVSDYSETVRLVAHNDGGIFTLGTVHIEQDMLYAGACVAGWLLLFVLLDAFLLLTVPGSPVRLADAELCACLWVLCAVAVLTCAPAQSRNFCRPSFIGSPASRSPWLRPVTLAMWCCNLRKIRGRRFTSKVSSTSPRALMRTAPIWMISPRSVNSVPWYKNVLG